MHRRRHSHRRKSHSRRKGHLRRNAGANTNVALLGLALVGGVAAWYFLSGNKSTKPDPRNLPQPPGCNGDTRVTDITKAGPNQYIVGYADGRIGQVYPSGLIIVGCKDNSQWELAPGHDWFQTIDPQGNVHKAPYSDASLAK